MNLKTASCGVVGFPRAKKSLAYVLKKKEPKPENLNLWFFYNQKLGY